MDAGWIKLHRKILYNPVCKRPFYAWIWVYLLLRANHKEEKFMWNGGTIDIKEGQMLIGRDRIAQETGVPASTVEDILRYLENEQQIRQQKTNKYRIITILHWKDYQILQQQTDNKPTTRRQHADTNKKLRIKEVKNNTNTNSPAPPSQPFVWKNYLELMDNHKDEAFQLISHFFREKKITFNTIEQARIGVKRHLHAARQCVKFPKPKVLAALEKCKIQHKDIDWSLETVLKKLTN